MSIRALHYITGDTQQAGFGWIGGSQAFPADQLLLLNNGEIIQERARVESRTHQSSGRGIQTLSHVWEYQTGKFGTPVVINTVAAIGVGRAHAFSEYVMGMTDNVAELAEPEQMIRSAENFAMLDVETFMNLQSRSDITSEEEMWDPEQVLVSGADDTRSELDETWRLTLLSHYWKQASVRAFSEDTPETVRVCLGEFNGDDPQKDTEETIRQAKAFFARVVAPGLPKQVHNIASMAAGVDCGDTNTLYTALEFDVERNMFEDETLQVRKQRELRGYRLNEGELDFISDVCAGKIPAVVTEFFNRYRELAERPEARETETPFMADYRVWYGLYCADRIIKEGHSFIEKAGLTNEHGNPRKIRDTRACFLLLNQLHRVLEEDHQLNDVRRTKGLVAELMGPLETALLKVMQDDMHSESAEPFLLRRNEMVKFHRDYLYNAPEDQTEILRDLAVRDQVVSKAPQFVRCYPATPLRSSEADQRNALLLKALLPEVIRPLIDIEKKQGVVENKYLDELRSEAFADGWAAQPQNEQTRNAMADFLREEIRDSAKHYMLYKISLKYLPGDELLRTTLQHFTANNTSPTSRPEERMVKIAAYGARDYIASEGRANPDCVTAMNQYYRACFAEYRGSIGGISDIVKQLGGDTTEAMALIFTDGATGARMTPEEAETVFTVFGGENGQRAKNDTVQNAYTQMLAAQRDAMLKEESQDRDASREGLVRWIAAMVDKAPFNVDTSDSIQAVLESARTGPRMTRASAEDVFSKLINHAVNKDEKVRPAFTAMVRDQLDTALAENDEGVLDWIGSMISVSSGVIRFDTTESLKKIFEAAKEGERMRPNDAGTIFSTMWDTAESQNTVQRAFTDMLSVRRKEARDNRDPEGFDWLCEMADRSPWKDDAEWQSEQHTENAVLLCDLTSDMGGPAKNTTLTTVQGWLDEGTIRPSGVTRIQVYCNEWLREGVSEPTDLLLRSFTRIDDSCDVIRTQVFEQAKQRFIDELERPGVSFGDLVASCQPDVERAGRKLNDLYKETESQVADFLNRHFDTTPDLGYLIAEQAQIPENTEFYRAWQEKLSSRISSQQLELFNRQPNMEKLMDLRANMLQRSKEMHPALKAAYELLDGYEGKLEDISGRSEYEAISAMGDELTWVTSRLDRAREVRKTLCSSLRNMNYPVQKTLRGQSFRHAVCAAMMQAELTDAERSGDASLKGCPDWDQVLKTLFTKAELDEAARKPYAKENLPVLQRLLATTDTVRMMIVYGVKEDWGKELVRAIHASQDLHRYQNALARNKKMGEQYGLAFDNDGLVIDMESM